MRRSELEELLWQEIDGTLSEADRERLQKARVDAAEVDELRRSLAAMNALLGELGEVAPPPELRTGVRAEIAARRSGAAVPFATATGGWLGSTIDAVGAALAVRWPARLAYATIGLLIGALGLAIWSQQLDGGLDRSGLVGTVGGRPAATATAGGDGIVVEVPEGAGRLTLRASGEKLVADVALATAEPMTITLERPGEPLRLRGLEGALEGIVELLVAEGRIELTIAGPGGPRLFIGPVAGAPLTIRVASGERELVAAVVHPTELP